MWNRDPKRVRDAAGIGPYARERERLVPMCEMRGWNVSSGEADVRSWEVVTLSGRLLGVVRELLVDAEAGEVVMLEVNLAGSARHALVPIRLVAIDRDKRVVRADSGDLQEIEDAGDRTRFTASELSRVGRDVKYADARRERVIERRPTVEETVVRRRKPDDTETRL